VLETAIAAACRRVQFATAPGHIVSASIRYISSDWHFGIRVSGADFDIFLDHSTGRITVGPNRGSAARRR
jgi:hypothetical protein